MVWMSQWRETTVTDVVILGPQQIRTDTADNSRHKAALIPIKILLEVHPSQVVKKLNRAIEPRTVMV